MVKIKKTVVQITHSSMGFDKVPKLLQWMGRYAERIVSSHYYKRIVYLCQSAMHINAEVESCLVDEDTNKVDGSYKLNASHARYGVTVCICMRA